MKRQRGRGRKPGGGGGGHSGNRPLESNGPDVKIRGTAAQIYEKYSQYARDAQSGGDRVKYENYLQHAEHYFRVMAATMPRDRMFGQPGEAGQGGSSFQGQPGGGEAGQGGHQPGQGQADGEGAQPGDPMKGMDESQSADDDAEEFAEEDGDGEGGEERVEARDEVRDEQPGGSGAGYQGRRRRRGRRGRPYDQNNGGGDGGNNGGGGTNDGNNNGNNNNSALDTLARKQGAYAND
jgi:hypothetical protein